MLPWWEIKYFNKSVGLEKINSSMMPFHLLPQLCKMDIRNGHIFKTDQFEITIPNSNISLHMVSKSLWIDGRPHHVAGAQRVILFQRTEANLQGDIINQYIYLGLMTEDNRGYIVKYHVENNTWELKIHPNGILPKEDAEIQSLPALPEIEN